MKKAKSQLVRCCECKYLFSLSRPTSETRFFRCKKIGCDRPIELVLVKSACKHFESFN